MSPEKNGFHPRIEKSTERSLSETRISDAERLLAAIERGEDPDGDLLDLIGDAKTSGNESENIIATETAGIAIDEDLHTSERVPIAVGEQPIEVLEVALAEIAESRGEASVAKIVDEVERAEQQLHYLRKSHELTGHVEVLTGEPDEAVWSKISKLTAEGRPYRKHSARIQRLPISLPVASQEAYSGDAIRYASGPEMESVLEGYGVSPEVIVAAEHENWRIDAAALPAELQHVLLSAQLYEAISRSQDDEIKKQASERNSRVTVEDIWKPNTLHHVTKGTHLPTILKQGHLGVTLDENLEGGLKNNGGSANTWNINFGRPIQEISADSSHKQKIENLSYNNRGDVYIHYLRPEGCYREGEEYEDDSLIMLMSGGMPSTEISALTLRGGDQVALAEQTRDQVVEAGFFIPIFDIDGNQVYTKTDFETDMLAKQNGTYVSNGERRNDEQLRARQEAESRHIAWLESQAAQAGLSVEEYRARPVTRPDM